jgi:endoglucanase
MGGCGAVAGSRISLVKNSRGRFALCFFVLVLAAPILFAQQARHGFVHANAEELVDGSGQPVFLRGINLGNWFEVEGYMFHFDGGPQSPREIEDLTKDLLGPARAEEFWRQWRANYITEADIDQIAKMGFNSVRVPLHWKFFTSEDAEGFRLVDQLVEWARKDGIYVILDMHCAPGGQTGANIDDSWGYPWLYTSSEAQDETVAVWKRIAAHYKNNPTVLGYDLLNEPLPQWEKLQVFKRELVPVYMKIAAGIRQVDKNHVLILGGAHWDTDFGVFSGTFDPNTMFTFHLYWTEKTDTSVIQKYLDFRHQHHVPMWLGESGENKDAWVEGFRKTLEQNGVGWAFWTYKRMDATPCVVTFDQPAHWDEIVAFAKLPVGMGDAEKRLAGRPAQSDIDEAFADLLKKVQFAGERVNPGYMQALFGNAAGSQ